MTLSRTEAINGEKSLSKTFARVTPPPGDIAAFATYGDAQIAILEKTAVTQERLAEFRNHVASIVGHPVEDSDFKIIHVGTPKPPAGNPAEPWDTPGKLPPGKKR